MGSKLLLNFDRLKDADLVTKSGVIINGVTDNPAFPLPWPASVPVPMAARVQLDTFSSALLASQSRDVFKIAERDAARDVLITTLKLMAAYLEVIAAGDAKLLASTGYDLRRDTARTGGVPVALSAPEGLRAVPTLDAGSLNLRVEKLAGAVAYEVQTTQGDPGQEEGWSHAHTAAGVRIRVDGMKPGRTWARVRGVGRAGSGPWAQPVSVIVG